MTTSWARLVFNRHTLLAFAAGAAVSGGVVALAQNAGAGTHAFHHGAMMSGVRQARCWPASTAIIWPVTEGASIR